MNYQKSEPLNGDGKRALDFVATALSAAGFRIDQRTDHTLQASGPGMYNTKQSPLLAIGRLELSLRGGQLIAEAELSGASRMFRILGGVIALLAVVGCVVMFVALPARERSPAHFAPFLALAPWAILLPAMSRWSKERGRRAVDNLLHNAVVNSR